MERFITRTLDDLRHEQHRVAAVVARIAESGDGWAAELPQTARERLLTAGHFEEYADELEWTPREVVGHLRDSALVFHDRLLRLRSEDTPFLRDFRTTDPERVMGYRATPPAELAAGLAVAQHALAAVVGATRQRHLALAGTHEVDGTLALGDVLAFLPGHQQDHAEQLELLLHGHLSGSRT